MPAETLPQLPLVCLKTADFKSTNQVVEGKNTVIGKNVSELTVIFLVRPLMTLTFVRIFRFLDIKMYTMSRCIRQA